MTCLEAICSKAIVSVPRFVGLVSLIRNLTVGKVMKSMANIGVIRDCGMFEMSTRCDGQWNMFVGQAICVISMSNLKSICQLR
jgi:hypothetical protein